jgi:protein tyrosine phosphatase
VTLFVDLTDPRRENVPEYDTLLSALADGTALRVVHQRFPIADCSVPRSTGYAVDILDAIDAGLLNGETVYLHCKAGVGRTGTIAGLHLVRHGLDGAEALRRLEDCWLRDARSALVSRCPETSVQRHFILDWPVGH